MKTVLVTGAGGFIGSHLTEALVRMGCKVRAFVHYNSRNEWGWIDSFEPAVRSSIEIFAGDIRDPNGVRTAVKNCDTIFHLAALIGIPYSYHSPDTYIDTNVKGTLNVVQAARDFDVQRIVQTSTSEVYGTARSVPITEEHPLQGQSPYSASKIAADQIAWSFFASFKTPVVIARPFNTYGPRQSARAVIPTIISQIANGMKSIKLGALAPTRDFNFVKDTAAGFISIAQANDVEGEVINIGSNFEISMGDTVEVIPEVMSAKVQIELDAARLRPAASEVERLWADNSKAMRLTGWQPAYAGREGLRRGLEETVRWFRNTDNLKHYKHDLYNI